ncbi:MAG: SGNH/GDSL hydrolase family protein, partial [Clostridia bacterium]|nr:SGNH/GDSL hydrolase family protein [Clostridia bacterium]
EYNRQLIRFMKENDCPVNDLFALLNPDKENTIGPDCIHVSPLGAEMCAKAVADAIREIDR